MWVGVKKQMAWTIVQFMLSTNDRMLYKSHTFCKKASGYSVGGLIGSWYSSSDSESIEEEAGSWFSNIL